MSFVLSMFLFGGLDVSDILAHVDAWITALDLKMNDRSAVSRRLRAETDEGQ